MASVLFVHALNSDCPAGPGRFLAAGNWLRSSARCGQAAPRSARPSKVPVGARHGILRRQQGAFPRHRRHHLRGPRLEEPAQLQVLRTRQARRRQDDAGTPAVRRGLLAQFLRHRIGPVRRARSCSLGLGATPIDRARHRLDAVFEFATKLGLDYYCFHDRDMAPAGRPSASPRRTCRYW